MASRASAAQVFAMAEAPPSEENTLTDADEAEMEVDATGEPEAEATFHALDLLEVFEDTGMIVEEGDMAVHPEDMAPGSNEKGCSSLICRALAGAAWPPGTLLLLLILQNGCGTPPLAEAPPDRKRSKNHSVCYMFA